MVATPLTRLKYIRTFLIKNSVLNMPRLLGAGLTTPRFFGGLCAIGLLKQ